MRQPETAASQTPVIMFYDLNVPYSVDDAHLPRTLAFLSELGYNVVALNHSIVGKLPAQIVRLRKILIETYTDNPPVLRDPEPTPSQRPPTEA